VFGDPPSKPDVALDVDNVEVVPTFNKFALDPPLESPLMPLKNTPIQSVLKAIPLLLESAFGRKISA